MNDEIKFDIGKLNKFAMALKKKYVSKVGILTDTARKDGFGNVQLGAVHEFGSYSRNIPARSFLRVPLMGHGKDIIKDCADVALQAFVDGDPKKAYKVLGIAGEAVVQKAFETSGDGKWPGLKPATIARKGSSMPLIDTGSLRRSVTSAVATS